MTYVVNVKVRAKKADRNIRAMYGRAAVGIVGVNAGRLLCSDCHQQVRVELVYREVLPEPAWTL